MQYTTRPAFKTLSFVVFASLALSACGGKHSPRAAAVTTTDKNLSCEQLQLEMNDAMYIRRTAETNRGVNARNILWPFGYPATYMSSEEAIESADRRLAYLQSVFVAKNCERPL
jgi:hypothetical protein